MKISKNFDFDFLKSLGIKQKTEAEEARKIIAAKASELGAKKAAITRETMLIISRLPSDASNEIIKEKIGEEGLKSFLEKLQKRIERSIKNTTNEILSKYSLLKEAFEIQNSIPKDLRKDIKKAEKQVKKIENAITKEAITIIEEDGYDVDASIEIAKQSPKLKVAQSANSDQLYASLRDHIESSDALKKSEQRVLTRLKKFNTHIHHSLTNQRIIDDLIKEAMELILERENEAWLASLQEGTKKAFEVLESREADLEIMHLNAFDKENSL